MNPNDALRSLRYMLGVNDAKLAAVIALGGGSVNKAQVSAFLKQDDEEGYEGCKDEVLAQFLNGLVIYKRGADPARPPQPVPRSVTNNLICKKLRTAFQLKDTEIIALVEKSGMKISKAEVGAIFRAEGHRNYRPCGDQFLRYLLKGLTA
jgi:uncharacterized protein YehS (DUF1456 family)